MRPLFEPRELRQLDLWILVGVVALIVNGALAAIAGGNLFVAIVSGWWISRGRDRT